MSKPYILVVDDEPDIRQLVHEILEDEHYEVATAENANEARRLHAQRHPDLALLDIWMPDIDGITLLKEWTEGLAPPFPVIMMSGHATVETAVEATRTGAYDFLEKPLSMARLLLTVERALEAARLRRESSGGGHALGEEIAEPVGRSALLEQIKAQVRRLAQHDTRVLFIGEAGVGKRTFAHYLHAASGRLAGPFIDLSLAGLSPESVVPELFGREEKGRVHPGFLERAEGGTLLLDEIADLGDEAQSRLYAALEQGHFQRMGGKESVTLNARLLASTRRPLDDEVRAGRFHKELYYLLNTVTLHIPALRQHAEDIPELLNTCVDHFVSREKLPFRHFPVATQNFLRNHPWPGNVRELKNLVQRLLILGNGEDVGIEEVRAALASDHPATTPGEVARLFDLPLKDAREHFEKAYLEHHLARAGGNVARLASFVNVERTHLYRKLNALGIRFREKP